MDKKYYFFLGGYDAEMCEIRNILESYGLPFSDKKLDWGAKASSYLHEIEQLKDEIPVLVELNIDIPLPDKSIIIDHHCEKAGEVKLTSIEQIAELLGIKLNRWQQLISVNDRAHIKGLIKAGATDEEIKKIRAYDRHCQGVTEEEEQQAEDICIDFNSTGQLDILEVPFDHTSPVTDRLFGKYKNLLIITPKDINFFGEGQIINKLRKNFKNCWYGGNLPDEGFWGIKRKSTDQIDKIKIFLGEYLGTENH